MKIVAVPILDPKDIRWATKCLVELYRSAAVRIHLVNLQPAYPGHISRFFSAGYLTRIHREDGLKFLAPLVEALDKAQVPHQEHIFVGRKASRIVEFIESYSCSEVLLRTESLSMLQLGMESINSRIRRKLRALYPEGKTAVVRLRQPQQNPLKG